MTIGPAPMIRMLEMSVRFGIRARFGHKKKARLPRVPRGRAGLRPARAAGVRPESAGREGERSQTARFACSVPHVCRPQPSPRVVVIAVEKAMRLRRLLGPRAD